MLFCCNENVCFFKIFNFFDILETWNVLYIAIRMHREPDYLSCSCECTELIINHIFQFLIWRILQTILIKAQMSRPRPSRMKLMQYLDKVMLLMPSAKVTICALYLALSFTLLLMNVHICLTCIVLRPHSPPCSSFPHFSSPESYMYFLEQCVCVCVCVSMCWCVEVS